VPNGKLERERGKREKGAKKGNQVKKGEIERGNAAGKKFRLFRPREPSKFNMNAFLWRRKKAKKKRTRGTPPPWEKKKMTGRQPRVFY